MTSVASEAPDDRAPAHEPETVAANRQPHLRALGFERDPFPVVPDLAGFYLSRANEIIIAEVLHTIENRKGFLVLTGEVGLGKTTLSRRILRELDERGIQTALVLNTFYQGVELLREINRDFGLELDSEGLQSQMAALNHFLLGNLAQGINCVIVVDDAQQLSVESLELLRQISNLETDSEKLVQILLVGQPELDVTLQAHELRQLESRIVLKHRVLPYTLEETKQYVQLKLVQAGGHGRLQVTASAFRLLHRRSGGNPRQINKLMDRCLYAAIAFGSEKIDRSLVANAARDARAKPAPMPRARGRLLAQCAVLLLLLSVVGLVLLEPALRREAWLWARGNADPVVAPQSVVPLPKAIASDEAGTAESAGLVMEETLAAAPADEVLSSIEDPTEAVRLWSQAGATAVGSFLAAYNLERYSTQFADAVGTGLLDEISATIRLSTGLRLVSLPGGLPEGIEGYPVLNLSLFDAIGDEYLLFWRPEVWEFEHQYFQYHHAEVLALQKALLRLGHYAGSIDGLPGPLTSTALRRFQTTANLRASGMPDTATLFLLEHSSPAPDPGEPLEERLASTTMRASAQQITD
jgi:general secretion pathway protein A